MMKKLDEIMELMTDEMADFNTAVLELQKISEQLVKLSIPISTEALEKNLNIFLQKQIAEKEKTDQILLTIDNKLKSAQLILNYLIILIGTLGFLSLGLLGYFGYTANAKQAENLEIYQIVMESQNRLHQNYFAEHPEIKERYCQWLEGEK